MQSAMSDRKLKRPLTGEDIGLYSREYYALCREDFYSFRKHTTPGMFEGWWQHEVAAVLMKFYADWIAGKRPVLILQAPPQHGKSKQVTDFIAWASGKNPDLNTIYGSYSEDLGLKANMYLQRMIDGARYKDIFAKTFLNDTHVVNVSGRWMRNSYHMEFVGHSGSFRNVTVGGQINGMGLDLGIIDDPIKGRAEASSLVLRDKVWNWFTDDFFGRFSDKAGLIIIMTRWHLDDPVGRLLVKYPNAVVCRYPALAEKDEKWRKKGEPLFPELKSLEFLQDRKRLLTQSGFESVYQQNPIIVGGDMFPVEKFKVEKAVPNKRDIRRSVRYWDKAGTEGGTGAATAGVLMHELQNETFFIEHVVWGHWGALAREERIRQVAQLDHLGGRRVETWVEQEPGSGGKESAETTIRKLRGFVCKADKVTGSKEIRAEPYAAQVQAGNISVMEAKWNRDFFDEHELFPNGKYKDRVDAAGGAFAKLTVRDVRYDATMRWVRGA